jgi:hypothetical protein
MKKLWRALTKIIFWSYERGSWPYDVMVVLIVLIVLVTPRSLFHDQPQSSEQSGAGIVFVAQDAAAHTETYRLDVKLFSTPEVDGKPGPELERETHEILSHSVGNLKGQIFQVRRISPVRSDDGSLQYYEVEVKR